MRRTRCRLGQRTSTNGISPRNPRSSTRTYTPGGTVTPPPVETFFMLQENGDKMQQENGDFMLLEGAP